jgi:hypothetical protein
VYPVMQYAATDSLDESYCPWLRGKARPASAVGPMSAGASSGATGKGKGVQQACISQGIFEGCRALLRGASLL